MAVQQNKKSPFVANVQSIKQYSDSNVREAALFKVNPDATIDFSNNLGRFLINPSTWKETKTANWAPQQTPGQSDPILQWISSGPRTVSFSALVTADNSYFVTGLKTAQTAKPNLLQQANTYLGGIAAAFYKVSAPAARIPTGQTPSDLDITLYLNYYRSLLYPVYDQANLKLQQSPPLVVLLNGTSVPKYPYFEKLSTKNDVWVVTNLEINITKQLPNLAPMEAIVSFQLMQYNINSYSSNRFLEEGQ